MKLSPHFSLSEFTLSQTAIRKGINNDPTSEVLGNLKVLCTRVLEPVRALLGHPMFITSGYRCPALNGAIGGSPNSAHIKGLAADFVCPMFGKPRDIAELIMAKDIEYDQMIYEGGWVHISTANEPRRETLTALFEPDGVVYRVGIV